MSVIFTAAFGCVQEGGGDEEREGIDIEAVGDLGTAVVEEGDLGCLVIVRHDQTN